MPQRPSAVPSKEPNYGHNRPKRSWLGSICVYSPTACKALEGHTRRLTRPKNLPTAGRGNECIQAYEAGHGPERLGEPHARNAGSRFCCIAGFLHPSLPCMIHAVKRSAGVAL